MKVLVTGGTGYIGSHTVIELIANGHTPFIVDNLVNSKASVLERLHTITGQIVPFAQIDVTNRTKLSALFEQQQFDAAIHFAGLKAVGESVESPLQYYRNNIDSTFTLCEVMKDNGVKQLVFSSSATVYGDPKVVPITEDSPMHATNPYGQTKLMIEQILQDLRVSDSAWKMTLLRYFNPVGAHSSGLIGEDPNGIPNNLMPFISQVAAGTLPKLKIFGDDYPTPDGTGVRDYIHVVDLAKAHVNALEHLSDDSVSIYNLGTGKGYSVLDIVAAFEKASGCSVAYEIAARRPGDIATCYADASKARKELGWHAEKSLDDMCADSWRWQNNSRARL